MSNSKENRRLPRSMRKHLRNEKARLRRELPADEAERAIERLSRGPRRGAEVVAVSPKQPDRPKSPKTEEKPVPVGVE